MEERLIYLARGVTRKDTFGDKRTFADGQSISIIEQPLAGAARVLEVFLRPADASTTMVTYRVAYTRLMAISLVFIL